VTLQWAGEAADPAIEGERTTAGTDGDTFNLLIHPMAAEGDEVISTLGPAGTSSEAAARYLAGTLGHTDKPVAVALFRSYEEAWTALREKRASRLLVANAYQGISKFYMDRSLGREPAILLDNTH
jgi:hypothetical protein